MVTAQPFDCGEGLDRTLCGYQMKGWASLRGHGWAELGHPWRQEGNHLAYAYCSDGVCFLTGGAVAASFGAFDVRRESGGVGIRWYGCG